MSTGPTRAGRARLCRSIPADIHRLRRRFPLRQHAASTLGALVVALALLGGSSAATTAATPDQVGQWSAPIAFPIVAVHMSLEPNGQILMLDGFGRGRELGAPLGSGVRNLHLGPLRPEPLLRRPRPARRRPNADRRRAHRRRRRPRRHDDLRLEDEHLHPRAGHVGRPVVPDRDRAAGRPRARLLRRQHRPEPARRAARRSRMRRSTRCRRSSTRRRTRGPT